MRVVQARRKKNETMIGNSAKDTQNWSTISSMKLSVFSSHIMSFPNAEPQRMLFLLSGIFYFSFITTPFHPLGFSFSVTSPEKPWLTLQIRIYSPVIYKRTLYLFVAMITPKISTPCLPSGPDCKPHIHHCCIPVPTSE